MYKLRPFLVLVGCVLLTVVIVVLKIYFTELIFFNSGLMLILLLTVFVEKKVYTHIFTVLSLLIILATIIFNKSAPLLEILPNQLLAAFVASLTSLVVLHIKSLNQAVENEQQNLKALFDHSAEGIILTSDKGQILMVNPEAQKQFDYSDRELIGKPLSILMPDRLHEQYAQFLDNYDTIPENQSFKSSQDLHGLRKTVKNFPWRPAEAIIPVPKKNLCCSLLRILLGAKKWRTALSSRMRNWNRLLTTCAKMNTNWKIR